MWKFGKDERKCCFQFSFNFSLTSFVVCLAIIGKKKQHHQFLNLIPFSGIYSFFIFHFLFFLIKSLSLVGINERDWERGGGRLSKVKLFDVIKTPSVLYFWEHVVLVSNFPPLLIAKTRKEKRRKIYFHDKQNFQVSFIITREAVFSWNWPENADEITGKFIEILCVLFHAL